MVLPKRQALKIDRIEESKRMLNLLMAYNKGNFYRNTTREIMGSMQSFATMWTLVVASFTAVIRSKCIIIQP